LLLPSLLRLLLRLDLPPVLGQHQDLHPLELQLGAVKTWDLSSQSKD
jgi:hypothetical protein